MKYNTFLSRKQTWKSFLQNGVHFVAASMCYFVVLKELTFLNGIDNVYSLLYKPLTLIHNYTMFSHCNMWSFITT